MIDPTVVFRARGDVRYRSVPPETVVVRQSGPEVLVLNGVGGRVLELLDGRSPVGEVLEALLGEYDVDRRTLERDVLAYLGELESSGIIEAVSSVEKDGG